jgi:hypothetical protein
VCTVKSFADYTFIVSDPEVLHNRGGTRVQFYTVPKRKTRKYQWVCQNIEVRCASGVYTYFECWSLNTSKSVYDTFFIPEHLRHERYWARTETWLESGSPELQYRVGRLMKDGGADPDTPWGLARGSHQLRACPAEATPIRRETILVWDNQTGVLQPPLEFRGAKYWPFTPPRKA